MTDNKKMSQYLPMTNYVFGYDYNLEKPLGCKKCYMVYGNHTWQNWLNIVPQVYKPDT